MVGWRYEHSSIDTFAGLGTEAAGQAYEPLVRREWLLAPKQRAAQMRSEQSHC